MNNKEGKHCPLVNQVCLLDRCALFSQKLNECEISVMNYNLWQLKEHIRLQTQLSPDLPEPRPAVKQPGFGRRAYPGPGR
jgi:hypothetical protein